MGENTSQQMELHVATILLLFMLPALTGSNSLWLWTEGCNKVIGIGTIYNISVNSPAACFQSCDGKTKSVALQENRCACEFDNAGTLWNNDCSVICPGDVSTICGNQATNVWSIYTKADESEIEAKGIRLNVTGCVSVILSGGYKYHVLPCNFSMAYPLCEQFGRCHSSFYKAPNWTFACGYTFGGRYPVTFSQTDRCMRSDDSSRMDHQFWIGLFAPRSEDDKVISTTEQTSIDSAIQGSPTATPSLMTSFDIRSTEFNSMATLLTSTPALTSWSENSTNGRFTSVLSTTVTVHSDKTHSAIPVSNTNSYTSINILPTPSHGLYQTTLGIVPPTKLNSPDTTPLVKTESSRNEGKEDKVSVITSITAGAVALCLLIAVIGLAIYVRKHATQQAYLGSASDIGRHSDITMKTFTNVFTDERSQQVIRSINDDQDMSIPNLTGSTRADLRMGNNTFSGLPSVGNRARENEYVLY